MTDTISWLEFMWSILLVIGVVFSLWTTAQAVTDLRALKHSGRNGLLLRRARNDMRTEIIRLIVLGSMLYLAYFALTTPDDPNAQWSWQLITLAVVLGWIPLLLGYDALQSTITRKYILDEIDKRDNHDNI